MQCTWREHHRDDVPSGCQGLCSACRGDAILALKSRWLTNKSRLYHLLGLMLVTYNSSTGLTFGEASERSRKNDLRTEKCGSQDKIQTAPFHLSEKSEGIYEIITQTN